MAQARLSMRKIREILRLKFELGLTERQNPDRCRRDTGRVRARTLGTPDSQLSGPVRVLDSHRSQSRSLANSQASTTIFRRTWTFRDVPRIAVIGDIIATSGQPTCKLVNGWTQVLVVGSIETPPVRNKQAGCVTGSRQDAAGRFRLLVLGNQIPTPKHSSVLHLNLCGTLEECAHIPWVPARSDQAKQFEMGQ